MLEPRGEVIDKSRPLDHTSVRDRDINSGLRLFRWIQIDREIQILDLAYTYTAYVDVGTRQARTDSDEHTLEFKSARRFAGHDSIAARAIQKKLGIHR